MTILDLKYAVRLLVKSPWFTLLTVLVLAGGLGISIYTFAALNTMIYDDLPLPQGSSIVRDADWRIFEFTRTPPLLGRGFVPDDAVASAAVLGFDTWQSVFSGESDIVGELVRVDGRLTRVVGVMPEGYAFPRNTQIWLPLSRQELEPLALAGSTFDAYARLAPGTSAEAAEAELTALLQRLRRQLVSVLPASTVNRVDPSALLKDDIRGGGRGTGRISRTLVTIQVGLIAAVIVVGSAAAVIAQRAASYDFGIDSADLFMMNMTLSADRYAEAEERLSLSQRLLQALRATPGIDAAAVMHQAGVARFAVEAREYATPDERPVAWLFVLSETPSPIGPILVEGRAFDGRDNANGPRTAIVSESLAKTHWPNESALGRRIETPPSTTVIVRHFGGEAPALDAMYAALGRIDPTMAPDIRTYESVSDSITLFSRAMTKLFAGCGAFAILLAVTGIYGMSSNAVGAVLVVSAAVLLSIYVAVRGVIRSEPSTALRLG